MNSATEQALPALARTSRDVPLMARVSGVLYVCGAFLVVLSLALPHPASANQPPMYAVAFLAFVAGGLMYFSAERVSPWMIHFNLAGSSALVSLCVYFSGVAADIYSVMFVWVAIVAACIASRLILALHISWVLVTYAVALAAVGGSVGFSSVTRFILTGVALSAAGAAVSWLVEGRRNAEAGLHREIENREALQRELEHLAYHDPLTGVANRRRLAEYLDQVLADARRSHRPLCLIALDLDGFKEFNDLYGHAAGDRLLKSASSSWDAVLRDGDLITRMGGDEFLIVLPNCRVDVAKRIAARLRDVVPDEQSCSTGISCWNGRNTADELLAAADAALYETKNARSATLAG